jgi:hypothetical protein
MPVHITRRYLKSPLIFFLAAIFHLSLQGQDPDGFSEIQDLIYCHIPVENQNWEISQSPVSGLIYFANSAGLVEYNGITSRVYTMPYRQGIRSVYVNKAGKIFTGSFEDFGYWDRDLKGSLNYHSLTQGVNIMKNDEFWNIYELNNSVYFQSFTTIYRLDEEVVTGIPGPSIMLFLFRAGEKFIVQALGKGLYWFDGKEFEFVEGSGILANLKVHSVIERGKDLWICSSNNGVIIYDGKKFVPQKSEVSEFLKQWTCNAGLALNDSLIVFGTILKGIVFCDENGAIQKRYNYSNGLNNNTVLSMYKDISGDLWIGLDEGTSFIDILSPFIRYENFTGNLGTIYTAIRNSDQLYLGTNHGLFVADIYFTRGNYNFRNLRIIPNTQGQVWTLSKFDDQILCGHNDGTFVVNESNITWLSDITGGWSLKQYNDILIEGTYTGIISYKKDNSGRWTFRNRIRGFIEPTRSVEVDYLGYIWATHPHKGIYRLEFNEEIDSIVNALYFSSINETPNKITISRINNQMVFMTSENIFAFNYETRKFFPLNSLSQGLGEYVKSSQIIPFKKSTYWFINGNRIGLFEISRDLEAKKILEFTHEFADLPGREQQIIPLDFETLMIPTRQAFITINLDRLNETFNTSFMKIDKMVFSGKSSSTIIIPNVSDSIAVPNRENNVIVFLADPSFFDQERKEYLYRIVELGETWHKTTTDNFSFLNLKFGHYNLQVKSTSGDYITGAEFTIRRPYWLSTVAIVIYVITIAGLIILIIKIFQIELNRQKRLLEYEIGKGRLESELDSKSYELMLTMRYLIEKNEIMTELNEQIIQLREQSTKLPVKIIREMERIINNGLNSQTEEWKNAMNNLKLSQQGFFKMMLEKYPHLTPNDLRLCSYLRMNFSTKEIAKLLNISDRAVEISRYRLRRKMNISQGINLTEYLIKESGILD